MLKNELKSLPLSAIRPDPTALRDAYSPEEIAQNQESMRLNGLLYPILVRDTGDGGFEIIAGTLRWTCAKNLKWTSIDARVYPKETSAIDTEILALSDDLQNETIGVLDEARAYKRLTEAYKLTHREIAQRMGVPHSKITEALLLLTLPESIQGMVARATISARHAREILRINLKDAQIRIAEKAAKEEWGVRRTHAEVEAFLNPKPRVAGKAAHPEETEADPLGERWPELTRNPLIAPQASWTVEYLGTWRWRLEFGPNFADVSKGAAGFAQAIGSFFTHLGEALRGKTLEIPDDIRLEVQRDAKQTAPKAAPARLPKTPAERAEIEAAARSGPYELYKWVYGEKDPMTAGMKGRTWKDFDRTDPIKAMEQLLEVIKEGNSPGT